MKRIKRRGSGIFIKLALITLITYATVTLINLSSQISAAEKDLESRTEEVEILEQKTAALEYDIENSDDEETIEGIARNKLGLVLPGEKVYYDVSN